MLCRVTSQYVHFLSISLEGYIVNVCFTQNIEPTRPLWQMKSTCCQTKSGGGDRLFRLTIGLIKRMRLSTDNKTFLWQSIGEMSTKKKKVIGNQMSVGWTHSWMGHVHRIQAHLFSIPFTCKSSHSTSLTFLFFTLDFCGVAFSR